MQRPMRVVLSGPESSGKSTLCAWLADRFGLPFAPEYARSHLESGGCAPQSPAELAALARKHLDWQSKHLGDGCPLGILDTDLLNYVVWSAVAFGSVAKELEAAFVAESQHFHLLCEPDLPWEPDPLREFPELARRHELFRRYQCELDQRNLNYAILSGTGAIRHQLAETILGNLAWFPSR